jgi:hypothetical protein
LIDLSDLAATHFEGVDIDADSAIATLTRHHIAAFEHGDISDSEIAVAVSIARRHENEATGRRLLTDYLARVRRPGSAPSMALVDESLALGVDARRFLEGRWRQTITAPAE